MFIEETNLIQNGIQIFFQLRRVAVKQISRDSKRIGGGYVFGAVVDEYGLIGQDVTNRAKMLKDIAVWLDLAHNSREHTVLKFRKDRNLVAVCGKVFGNIGKQE